MMNEIEKVKQTRISLATSQQRLASDPQKSVWVEASAGTGKTKVLSDRVLRLLLNGVPPERILCLTYTKAAAVEMSTRIAKRLSRWAVMSDEKLKDELESLLGKSLSEAKKCEAVMAQARRLFAQLLDTLGGMKIQTIHSFCQEILKRFPLEARISPYFEVMDDRSTHEALEEVKRSLLQKIETEPESRVGKALALITKKMSESSFPKLMNELMENRNKISRILQNNGGVDALVSKTAERIGVDENENAEQVLKRFFAELPRALLEKFATALQEGSDTDKKKSILLKQILNASDPEAFYADYRSLFITTDGSLRKTVATQKVLSLCPQIAEVAEAEFLRLKRCDNQVAAAGLMQSTKAVLFLADDLTRGYVSYKKTHSKADYEDLIVFTRGLLENPQVASWVLYKLDGGIDNILIDEAQDTSPDQWAIIRSLSEEFFAGEGAKNKNCTIFAVGDRKQSIYSFQGADPAEFERMRRFFSNKLGKEGAFSEVNLDVSFRSTAAVLDMVNCVFEDETAKKGVVPSEEDVVHISSRIGEGGKVELWALEEEDKDETVDVWRPPVERIIAESSSSKLARQIALKIKSMVDGKEQLASQNRPLRYKDFMVLVQRRNGFVEEFVRACKNCGVAVAGVDKISLLQQIAVQDLVSVGKFLLLPSDDLTLAEILKSPLWGLDDGDLFELCYNRGLSSLWQKLCSNSRFSTVCSELQTLLNMADYKRPFELYSYILNKMEGRKKFVSRLGLEAEDGIDEFMNLCLDFEQEHIPSLQYFIEWIEKDEVEIKRELEQSESDMVRLMTVHGSKGLQAPVVILPDTVRIKNVRKESGLLMDDVLYYPFGSADYEVNCEAIKQREKELSLEEYRRLLYVALTRAEERLCICGYKKTARLSDDSWYEICRRSLQKIAEEKEDGSLVYEVKQVVEAVSPKEKSKEEELVDYPLWLRENAKEESALARPYAPSHGDEEEDVTASPLGEKENPYRFSRGRLIHKLLQYLPACEEKNREYVVRSFLQENAKELPEKERTRLLHEVLGLIADERFASLFGEQSKSEVPIMGQVGDRIISGQIDRLIVGSDTVKIIDFKTNRPAARCESEVPELYKRQMEAYRVLVEKIYPDKKVETYILWTDTANLMLLEK